MDFIFLAVYAVAGWIGVKTVPVICSLIIPFTIVFLQEFNNFSFIITTLASIFVCIMYFGGYFFAKLWKKSIKS